MRIDGGTKASGGQQAQSRFEQAMARELSRANSGKTPTESNVRTNLAATSKRKAPGSERVGVDFKASQAGKTLKALQDKAGQILSKTMAKAGETAKSAFGTLAATAEGAMGKAKTVAQSFGEGMAKAGFGKEGFGKEGFGRDGAAFGKAAPGEGMGAGKEGAASGKGASGEGAATASTAKEGAAAAQTSASGTPATAQGAQGDGPRTGGPAGSQTTPATAPPQGASTERAAAATPAPAEAPGAAPAATTTGAEASSGAQDGRAALAAQNAPALHEAAVLLQNPWLQSAARKAAANGAELSMVFQLGSNIHGAEFVSVATDDTGFITGPEIEISLTEGALDTKGNWVAQRGEGMLGGVKVTLEPDADGCAFVSDGEPDNPATVAAHIIGAEPLRADVIAVRKLR